MKKILTPYKRVKNNLLMTKTGEMLGLLSTATRYHFRKQSRKN